MSAWVLILYITAGYSGGPTAVDMPSKAACERELSKVDAEMKRQSGRFGAYGFCLNREGQP
jgi:hypothetical protein